jgi:hypothetical protein
MGIQYVPEVASRSLVSERFVTKIDFLRRRFM